MPKKFCQKCLQKIRSTCHQLYCSGTDRERMLRRNQLIVVFMEHIPTFYGALSGTTRVSPYQKGKTNLDFTEARDNEWQWHQLGHMQVCTSFQTDNHTSIPPLSFLQAGCLSCCPINSIKALKALVFTADGYYNGQGDIGVFCLHPSSW